MVHRSDQDYRVQCERHPGLSHTVLQNHTCEGYVVQFAVAARIEIMSTSIAYEDHASAPWLSGAHGAPQLHGSDIGTVNGNPDCLALLEQ